MSAFLSGMDMLPDRGVWWKFTWLCVASALLAGCASNPQRSIRGDLGLDTETVAKVRHVVSVSEGASPLASAATPAVASTLAQTAPVLLALPEDDNAVGELEERLVECARLAERQVNFSFFGNRSPTREECGEEVMVDGCPEPITRARLLGKEKHVVALQCTQEVIEQLWPAPFSINQRYRYYPNAKVIEPVSREEEARLIAQGCTRELWRTIKPDIVLHADRHLLRAALILDFKFPCPGTNEPRWTRYGESSAYAGETQDKIYREALGGESVMISPRKGISR
jgi:hypothetical protein